MKCVLCREEFNDDDRIAFNVWNIGSGEEKNYAHEKCINNRSLWEEINKLKDKIDQLENMTGLRIQQ